MKDLQDIRFMPEYNQWCAVQPQGKKLPTYQEWAHLYKLQFKNNTMTSQTPEEQAYSRGYKQGKFDAEMDRLNITPDTTEIEEIVEQFEKRMPLITSHGLLLEARLTPTSYLKMKEWLRTILHQQLQKARKKERERILIEISDCQQEHNDARHGDTPDDAYDRVHDCIRFNLSELDQDKK